MRLYYINLITTHGRRVWSLALDNKEDLERFKELGWGLRTWDQWEWNDCLPREIHVNDKQSVFHWGDKRFGDDWPARHRSRPKEAISTAQGVRLGEAGGPGRIPAQLIAHILFYFSKQNDLVLDPMAGGGVTPDTCLALSRRCWAFDMTDRPKTRPEIEPHTWTPASDQHLSWPVSSKEKADLIIFDPPASPEGEADGGQVRHTLIKRPPTMTEKAYPPCRRKNTLNSLRPSSPS